MEFENNGFMNYFGLRVAAITPEAHAAAVLECAARLDEATTALTEAESKRETEKIDRLTREKRSIQSECDRLDGIGVDYVVPIITA